MHLEVRMRNYPALNEVIQKNLFVTNYDGTPSNIVDKIVFPKLPEADDGKPICYQSGNSKEENAKLAEEMEKHLSEFRFLETSEILSDSMTSEDEKLPTITRLTESGELKLVKISKTGQLIEITDQVADWWQNFTFLTNG